MSTKKVSKSSHGPVKKTSRSSNNGAGPQGKQQLGPGPDDGSHGILEGISSLHTWIKSQTMIRPAKLGVVKREGGVYEEEDEDDELVISLTSRDPNTSGSQVRWDHTAGEFLGVQLCESLIEHLDIESIILHRDTEEARAQVWEQRQREVASEDKSETLIHIILIKVMQISSRALTEQTKVHKKVFG